MEKQSLPPSIVHFYPWPLVLVTSADDAGRPNIIALAAASPCSFRPPTLGIAVAPARYSHDLIVARGEFGLCLPSQAQLEQADLCGCISGREGDKFAAAGFTPLASTRISVPLIAECPIGFECRLVHTAHLGSHDWFIGEIVAVQADPQVVEGERIVPEKLAGVLCSWGEYFAPGGKVADWHFAGARRRPGAS